MAKEIEEYFVKRLQSYLLEYLQDFSQNNMAKFSLGISSNIILKNLQIKKQALLNFSFPMYIIDGKINSITINMPLNYKAQQPEMIIEGVDLLVCTIQEANLFVSNKDQQSQQGVENLKKHKLKIWEEQMAKYFEQLSPPNWIQKIVDGIYNNMSIQIKSFLLKFYNYSIFGCETQLRIKTDIYIKATDKQFQQKFNSDLNSIFKLIEIKKLGITFFYQQTKKNDQSKLSPRSKSKVEQNLLSPIDIQIKLTLNKNQEQLTKPIQNIAITIDNPVIFQINKETKNYLMKLNEVLQNLEIVQDNFHFRPKCEVKNNYGEWWKYLISAVMQNQKNHKLDLGYSSRRLVLMKRYIELYKRKQTIILVPWLTSWTHQDEIKFKKCEDNLSLKDLLKYREWAFQEIRIEAKRYYHSSKDGQNQQGVKPILEIWTNTINNQNSFKDQKKRDDDIPIELEDDEKINLYEILERDKTQVLSSYLKGQNSDPEQIKTQILVKIHSIFIIIYENRPQSQILYGPKNTKIFSFCQCKKCIQLVKKPILLDKKKSSFQQNPSLTEIVKQTQKYQNDEESFQTAKEIDSFYEDIEDLNNEESSYSQTSSYDQKNLNQQTKQNQDQQRVNKFILSISFIGIRIPIQIYQNGRIKTNEKDYGLIVVGEIKFITPGMITKVMDDKLEVISMEDRQSPLFQKKESKWKNQSEQVLHSQTSESQKKMNTAKLSDFVTEMFEVSISKDQSYFSSSEQCFQQMCKFLEQNQMLNVSLFLIDYENDKHGFQDFSNEQFKKYDKYFFIPIEKDEEFDDSMLLHVIKQNKSQNKWSFIKEATMERKKNEKADNSPYWTECQNKHRFLQEVHNKLIEIIKKNLFPLFLEDNADKILPSCIINLKEKLTYNYSGQYNLSLNLYLEGERSEYRIAPNSEKKKKESQQQIQEEQQSNEFFQVKITPFKIFLSTKSINSLIDFFQSMDKTSLSQRQLYVTQDHKLLECILKSKPLGQETIKPPGLKFTINLDGKQKVRIVSDQLSNMMKTELKFQIKKFCFSTIKLDELFQDYKEKPTLYKQHSKFFSAAKLTIKQLKIAHKYFSPDYYYKNEELKSHDKDQNNDDKKATSTLKPLSKQVSKNNQQDTIFKPQNQSLDPKSVKQSLSKQSSQQPFQLMKQNKKKDPKTHIKGIKQTILKMQIVAIKLNAKIENHALLTDSKLYIQIPFLNLRLNDSFVCFIEFLQILQQHLKNDDKPQYKNKISQDSLLKAELDTLFHDHKEQNTDCKHCILKYRKTIELTNILFGVIQDFSKDSYGFPCWFHILDKLLKEVENYTDQNQKKYGIKISFQSSEKGTNHGQYKSVLAFPKFAITRDLGYFKDNIMIHCSASTFKNDGIVLRSTQKLEDFEQNQSQHNQFEKNNHSFQIVSQSASHRSSGQIQQIPEKLKKEKNYILIKPAYQVKEQIQLWQKLDDKFIFYCRSNEKDMFKLEPNQKEYDDKFFDTNSIQIEEDPVEQNNNQQDLYVLFYCNRPLRSELIQNKDNFNRNEKSNKKKFFFSLQQIKAVFCNQYAACNILTTVRNISRIKSIFSKVHKIFNSDQQQQNIIEQNKLQESPIKLLDDMIISANISNIFLQSNESNFKLLQFQVMLNLELMNGVQNIKLSGHNKNSSSIGQQETTTKQRAHFALCDDYIIMRCKSIKFNFNTVSIVEVKSIHIKKQNDSLFFEVQDIDISIKNKFTELSENLLIMPIRDKIQTKKFAKSQFSQNVTTRKLDTSVALSVKLDFQNQNPKIHLIIQQGQIQLSQQLVQDLLITVNSFYLINLEEQISLRQHLLKYLFKQDLEKTGGQIINLFTQDQTINNSQFYFILDIDIEEFQIALQQRDIVFFSFEFSKIKVKKKLNQDLEIDVNSINLKPQTANDGSFDYKDLLLLNGNPNINNNLQMKFKLENKIIHIENVKFYMISKYLNELDAFVIQIEKILQKNKEDLAERYQNDFDLQLQIKQQETLEFNKEDLQLIVQIKNSQVIVPQSSCGQNLIKIKFVSADLKVLKDLIAAKIPEIMEQKIEIIDEKKLIVDYEDKINQSDIQELYITKLDAQLKQVEVDYEIYSGSDPLAPITGVLLYSDSIQAYMNLPSFEQYLGTSGWKYKDCSKIITQNLSMSLDLGKLLKVQGYVEENFKEKSTLFEFQQSKLQKINFNLSLKQMTVQLTRYSEVDKDKLDKMKNQKVYENRQHRQSKQYNQVKQIKNNKNLND